MRNRTESQFLAALRALPAADPARGVLVACSGGADSVALAHLCAAVTPVTGGRFTLACLDHRLRPESAAEGEQVAALAARLGLPCALETLPLPETLAAAGGNPEATARRLRYAALARIAAERGCAAVYTGHIADDLAETLWLWLLRGTGLRGLSPLKRARPIAPGSPIHLCRPLLDFTRDDLRRYLGEIGGAWSEDATNADVALRRNRIRHRLLPRLKTEFGFDAVPAAARLARQAGEIGAFLDDELAARGFPPGGEGIVRLDLARLRALPPILGRWLLAREIGRLGTADDEMVRRLWERCAAGATGRRLDLPAGLRAEFTADEVRIAPRDAAPPAGEHPALPADLIGAFEPAAGVYDIGPGWRLHVAERDGATDPPPTPFSARFDLDRLNRPMRWARPEPGLRIRPLGGPGGRRLSDIFIDRKVPRRARADWPLLLDAAGRVLWAPGLVRGEGAPVTENTRRCLCLDLRPETP